MAFRFPIRAPIIETTIESTHPPHIGIHIMLFQKLGSRIDDKISKALQIKGTYQILFGFSLTIIKQPAAIIKSLIIWLINPVSVCGVSTRLAKKPCFGNHMVRIKIMILPESMGQDIEYNRNDNDKI